MRTQPTLTPYSGRFPTEADLVRQQAIYDLQIAFTKVAEEWTAAFGKMAQQMGAALVPLTKALAGINALLKEGGDGHNPGDG